MGRLQRFRVLATRVPDRAILTCGLLLTVAAVLYERAGVVERERAAVAGAVQPLTAALQKSFQCYETLLQQARTEVYSDLANGANANWTASEAPRASDTPPGFVNLLVLPGAAPQDSVTTERPRFSLLAPTAVGRERYGALCLPVCAERATVGSAAWHGSIVALCDLDSLLGSLTAEPHLRVGVQLSQLPPRLNAAPPKTANDQAVEFDYAGPRGWVANSVLVIADQPWLLRWSIPATGQTWSSAALARLAIGTAASILLYVLKRRLYHNECTGQASRAGESATVLGKCRIVLDPEAAAGQDGCQSLPSPAGMRAATGFGLAAGYPVFMSRPSAIGIAGHFPAGG